MVWAKGHFIGLFLIVVALLIVYQSYYYRHRYDNVIASTDNGRAKSEIYSINMRHYLTAEEEDHKHVVHNDDKGDDNVNGHDNDDNELEMEHQHQSNSINFNCRMSNCFDYSKCHGRPFKVYIHTHSGKISENYVNIITAIKNSPYYTNQPDEACLFVLSIDTLDRDKLSDDYVKRAQSRIHSDKLWNHGKNHLIFNLFSGTWPDYTEDLYLDIENAILVKASVSDQFYRLGFDISFPLYKNYPLHDQQHELKSVRLLPIHRKYRAAFKGKRYLIGVGSETRNYLHHLHDGRDYIMVTTCKHGNTWQNNQDDRCMIDELLYQQYDYEDLLRNATFCLVPRGRRLGSFRFLEALRVGCIPIVLSKEWVLPFSEVIDWKKACIQLDEKLVFEVPDLLESITDEKILSMRQQALFLWHTYFQSINRIVMSTLEIIRCRVQQYNPGHDFLWNQPPGALAAMHTPFLDDMFEYPFYYSYHGGFNPCNSFAAIITVRKHPGNKVSTVFHRLIRTLSSIPMLSKIWVHWRSDQPIVPLSSLPVASKSNVSIFITDFGSKGNYMNNVSKLLHVIDSTAILFLEQDTMFNEEEISFAFNVWRSFPDRLVGYISKSHFWNNAHSRYDFTSKWLNHYSIVLLDGAFIHRHYFNLFLHFFPRTMLVNIQKLCNCQDITINALIGYLTYKPPIKLTQKKFHRFSEKLSSKKLLFSNTRSKMLQRQECLRLLTKRFGKLPLKRSYLRFDPLLFKDPISVDHMRYRKTENIFYYGDGL